MNTLNSFFDSFQNRRHPSVRFLILLNLLLVTFILALGACGDNTVPASSVSNAKTEINLCELLNKNEVEAIVGRSVVEVRTVNESPAAYLCSYQVQAADKTETITVGLHKQKLKKEAFENSRQKYAQYYKVVEPVNNIGEAAFYFGNGLAVYKNNQQLDIELNFFNLKSDNNTRSKLKELATKAISRL